MSVAKIVSVHSFRGGTGKSNTTANLAAQVALAGKRVGVVDTDIQSPGIHVLFGLDEAKMGKTLNDFMHGKASMKEVAFPVHEHVSAAPGFEKLKNAKLWLFPSSINGREISQILKEGVDFNKLNEALQNAISEMNLDYLFVDTHPGLNEETLLSIATSDVLVLILRPDDQDMQGTAVTADVARSLDVPHLVLMINKSLAIGGEIQILKENTEKQFNAPVAGLLPLSFDVARNASRELFSLSQPDHEWSKELRKVAQFVLSLE